MYKERDENKYGFTLMELIIVLAIISVLTVVSLPWMSASAKNYGLRSAVNDLYSNIQLTKLIAIKENRNCKIKFDTKLNHYVIPCLKKTVSFDDYIGNVQFKGRPNGTAVTSPAVTFTSKGLSSLCDVYVSNKHQSAYYRFHFSTSGGVLREKN